MGDKEAVIIASAHFSYDSSKLSEQQAMDKLEEILNELAQLVCTAFSKMENIFETVIKEKYPIISSIRKYMEENGALKAMMSGSGPTVFGIFEDEEALNKAALEINSLEHEFIYKIR